MSLNGLDSALVQDAYQVVLTEAGGWFLLKYTSRDSVELLGQGRNGVSEARNAIAAYIEASPLFGLIMYRRRKILIKHIPDGTSRLLQARTAVHFSDILELYSPYETVLEISTPDALNDTALAASIQLHTASRPSPSPLPTGSRLDEIREDGEDGGPGSELPARSDTPTSISSVQRFKNERRAKKGVERPKRSSSLLSATDTALAPPSRTPPPLPATPPPRAPSSQYPVRDDSSRQSMTPLEPPSLRESGIESRASNTSTRSAESPAPRDVPDSASQTTTGASESTDATEMPSSPERMERKLADHIDKELPELPSRESSFLDRRPSTSSKPVSVDGRSLQTSLDEDPYDIRKYDEWFKPKVRLGPRPVVAPEKSKRPTNARVSALPASLKAAKQKQDPPRPTSSSVASTRSSQSVLSSRTFSPPAQPVAIHTPHSVHHTQPHIAPAQPLLVPFRPLPPPIPADAAYQIRPTSKGSIKSTTSHRSTALTQDKLRLMKAIELRKRQIKQSQGQQTKSATANSSELDEPPEKHTRKQSASNHQIPLPRTAQLAQDEYQTESAKADSGIDLKFAKTETPKDSNLEASSRQPPLIPKTPEPDSANFETLQPEVLPEELVDTGAQHPEAQQPDALQPEPLQPEVAEPEVPELNKDLVHLDSASDHEGMAESRDGIITISTGDASPNHSQISSVDEISSSESLATTERPASAQKLSNEPLPVPMIVMADGSELVTSGYDAEDVTTASIGPGPDSDDHLSISSDSEAEPTSPRMQNTDLARRRRGFVEQLDVAANSGNPDDFASDDDELLEELRSATFEEAQPIMVARSNLSNVPKRRPSADTVGSMHSLNITKTSTSEHAAADNSQPPVSPINTTTDFGDSVSRSRNVSSGISRRIQALAEMSNRPITPESSHSEQRERRPPPKIRPTSFRRQSSNRTVSPVSSHPSSDSGGATLNLQHDPVTNRNSVSVSARIVRPETTAQKGSVAPKLQRSDLKINQGEVPHGRTPPPIDTSRLPSETSSPALSPLSPAASVTSSEVRQMHPGSRFGRHRQAGLQGGEAAPARMMRNLSTTSLASNDESVTSKDSGKTSRFFKRISNMSFGAGGGRRSKQTSSPPSADLPRTTSTTSVSTMRTITAQPQTKASQKIAERLSVADMPPAVMVGDLNVQFPDSLLWKRRLVTIDGSGNLQFAIAQAMEIHKGVALKNFPLRDLRQPYTPDRDVQELAHSLVVELQNGTSLQLACEDSMTQRQVLHLLRTYWDAWNSAT